jgi:hypothetical protein
MNISISTIQLHYKYWIIWSYNTLLIVCDWTILSQSPLTHDYERKDKKGCGWFKTLCRSSIQCKITKVKLKFCE